MSFLLLLTSPASAQIMPMNTYADDFGDDRSNVFYFNETGPDGTITRVKKEYPTSPCGEGEAQGANGCQPVGIGEMCPPGQTWNSSGACIPAPDKAPAAQDPHAACRQRTFALATQCEARHSAAQGACSTSRVDQIVQQANAQNERDLQQAANTNQACAAVGQAHQNAARQISGITGSCQSAVNQCQTSCEQLMSAAAACPDRQAQAKASSLAPARGACAGELARRPQEMSQTAAGLSQVGSGDSSKCTGESAAGTRPAPSPTAANAKQEKETDSVAGTAPTAGDSGSGLPPRPSPRGDLTETGGKSHDPTTAGGAGVEEAYDVSGRNALSNSTGTAYTPGSDSLAALPGTPAQSENSEETEARGGNESAVGGSGAYGGSGRGARLVLPRKVGSLSRAEDDAMKAAGKVGEETPDLNAFLPGQRRVAGSMIAGSNGCRIPDPADPRKCAVHHGPTANIWSKMKERFELLRNAPPPTEYFFNEE